MLSRRSDGQFPMSSVHRVPSLECNNFPPSEFMKMCPEFGGGIYHQLIPDVTRLHLMAT